VKLVKQVREGDLTQTSDTTSNKLLGPHPTLPCHGTGWLVLCCVSRVHSEFHTFIHFTQPHETFDFCPKQ